MHGEGGQWMGEVKIMTLQLIFVLSVKQSELRHSVVRTQLGE